MSYWQLFACVGLKGIKGWNGKRCWKIQQYFFLLLDPQIFPEDTQNSTGSVMASVFHFVCWFISPQAVGIHSVRSIVWGRKVRKCIYLRKCSQVISIIYLISFSASLRVHCRRHAWKNENKGVVVFIVKWLMKVYLMWLHGNVWGHV